MKTNESVMKLCKDCKHYKPSSTPWPLVRAGKCLINGRSIYEARNEDAPCGIEGKYWEARKDSKNLYN